MSCWLLPLLHNGNNDDTGNESDDDDYAGLQVPLVHPCDCDFESKTSDASDEGEYDIVHGIYG